jgi:hypothetical protein
MHHPVRTTPQQWIPAGLQRNDLLPGEERRFDVRRALVAAPQQTTIVAVLREHFPRTVGPRTDDNSGAITSLEVLVK